MGLPLTLPLLCGISVVYFFCYMAGYYINSKNKMYHLVYDFAWMEFST